MTEAMTNTTRLLRKASPSGDRPPLPPFTYEDAVRKVRLAEDAWNTRDPQKAVLFCSMDSRWRNRAFLKRKWAKRDDSGNWCRSYGNENWEFDEHGLNRVRHACINDLPIAGQERKFHWPLGRRPDDHPSLSDLGL